MNSILYFVSGQADLLDHYSVAALRSTKYKIGNLRPRIKLETIKKNRRPETDKDKPET